MLIGLPASGKTTWAVNYINQNPEKIFHVISSDAIIEEKALLHGLTYSFSHKEYIEVAIEELEHSFKKYLKNGVNIIHDQTNLSVKTRKKYMDKVKGYKKTAVIFLPTEKKRQRRYELRKIKTGKCVPEYVIKNMIDSLELPSEKEGFDKIIKIQS